MAIGDDNITAPPEFGKNEGSRYISGIGKVNGNVKLLLDCEELFS